MFTTIPLNTPTNSPPGSPQRRLIVGGPSWPSSREEIARMEAQSNKGKCWTTNRSLAVVGLLAVMGVALLATTLQMEHKISTLMDNMSVLAGAQSLRSTQISASGNEQGDGPFMSQLYAWDEATQCRAEDFVPSEKYHVLVTGGAGFVGMHTSLQLAAMGHTVIAMDNLNHYYSPALKARRVQILEDHKITFLEVDVCDSQKVRKILKYRKIDRIIHLAAQAGVRYSLDHPMEYTHNNIDCFVELLEVLKTTEQPNSPHRIPLVYASSSSVYGKNTKIPFSETDAVIEQASLYGATKKSNELISHVYHSLYGIPSIGLRFFTVYGTHGRPDMAYFKFTDQILKGQPIDMYNHGEMQRDFTYIDDIVNGIIRCLDLPFQGTSNKADVVNLGNNRPEVLRHLIEVVEQATGQQAIINSKPMQPGDVVSTYADVRKAKCLLGYEPTTPLEVGIPKFVEWFVNENGEQYAESAQPSETPIVEKEPAQRRLLEFY